MIVFRQELIPFLILQLAGKDWQFPRFHLPGRSGPAVFLEPRSDPMDENSHSLHHLSSSIS